MSSGSDPQRTRLDPHLDLHLGLRDEAQLARDLAQSGHALPAGTRMHDYVITGLLGEGGFGIVYLAMDESLQREVAIKEYLPSSMALRAKDGQTVQVKSAQHQETFAMGLRSFVNEARLLARFDHPALVKVHRFWEAHGTAYMVMPYYQGPTLKATLAGLGHRPDEAELRHWLWPLLDALAVLHAAQCYHRDIAPDNILITAAGPLLLDFGAARRLIGDMTHAITVVLKPGYAPIEQYGEVPGMTQGPWTDLYALASVLYTAISGARPMPSVERLIEDRLRPLSELAAGLYRAPFLAAIDRALALRPADRPQSIEAFRALIDGRAEPAPVPPPAIAPPASAPEPAPEPAPAPAPAPTAAASSRAASAAAAPSPRAEGLGLGLVLGAAGLLALAGGGWALLHREPAAAPPPPAIGAPAVPAVVNEPRAPVPIQESAPPAPAPVPAPAPAPEPAPQPAPSPQPPAPDSEAAAPVPAPAPRPRPASRPAAPGARVPVPAPSPAPGAQTRAKCSDILQRASLEPLTASEQAYLRKECR